MKLIAFLSVALLSMFCLPLVAIGEQASITTIEKEGEAVLSDEMTLPQARAIALNNARRAAIEQASGVIVQGSSSVYNFQLISDLVTSATRGVIVGEDILADDKRIEGKQIVYFVKIKARVKPLEGREMSSIKLLKANVSRYGSPPSDSAMVFQDNDEIQVSAKINSDAYIHVFSITQDGMVSKLFPNPYFKGEIVSSESDFIFPDEKQRAMGLKLRVRVPRNHNRIVETILIVVAKEKNEFLINKKEDEATITDLMTELSEINASQWIEKALGYEIRK